MERRTSAFESGDQQLLTNVQDQLTRLLSQLNDLEEMREVPIQCNAIHIARIRSDPERIRLEVLNLAA